MSDALRRLARNARGVHHALGSLDPRGEISIVLVDAACRRIDLATDLLARFPDERAGWIVRESLPYAVSRAADERFYRRLLVALATLAARFAADYIAPESPLQALALDQVIGEAHGIDYGLVLDVSEADVFAAGERLQRNANHRVLYDLSGRLTPAQRDSLTLPYDSTTSAHPYLTWTPEPILGKEAG